MTRYDAPTKTGRREETQRRRNALLQILRPGRAVHARKLRQAVMPDRSKPAFHLMLRCMRADGYVIEAIGRGPSSRGFRLISEPGCGLSGDV